MNVGLNIALSGISNIVDLGREVQNHIGAKQNQTSSIFQYVPGKKTKKVAFSACVSAAKAMHATIAQASTHSKKHK